MHMNDRSTDGPGGGEQCHYPVDKARTSTSAISFLELGGIMNNIDNKLDATTTVY